MARNNALLITVATAFFAAAPVLAAEMSVPAPKPPEVPVVQTPAVEKPDLAGTVKNKASDLVEQARGKMNAKTGEFPEKAAVREKAAGEEALDVTRETVTVETPEGVSQEKTVTVTPESPNAAPK